MKQFLLKLTDDERKQLQDMARKEYVSQTALIRRRLFLEQKPSARPPVRSTNPEGV